MAGCLFFRLGTVLLLVAGLAAHGLAVAQSWTPRPNPVPEQPASREVTASWQPPADGDKPVVAPAVAELPVPAKPATAAKAVKPEPVAPSGQFWNPER